MAENKNAKYIMYQPDKAYLDKISQLTPKTIEEERKKGNYFEGKYMFHLDNSILPGGFYTDCHWMMSVHGTGVQTEIAHTHDFAETLGFVGSDTDHPEELNAEIELWLEDEKYTITKSCLIFVPANMKHLPLIFKRIDKPIFFWTASDSKDYGRTSGNDF